MWDLTANIEQYEQQLLEVFTWHPPDDDQQADLLLVRKAGLWFAATILAAVPTCSDRDAAIRKVREAVMTANAAIVLRGGA